MIVIPRPGLRGNTAIAFQGTTNSNFTRSDEDRVPQDFLVDNTEDVLLANAKARLIRVSNLPADWDDNGASRPSTAAVDWAQYLLKLLVSAATNQGLAWRDPLVSATPEGEIVLEWWRRNQKLTVYCSNDSASYIKVWEENRALFMEEGDLSTSSLVDLWKWLTLS